jgi:hypothetical protein
MNLHLWKEDKIIALLIWTVWCHWRMRFINKNIEKSCRWASGSDVKVENHFDLCDKIDSVVSNDQQLLDKITPLLRMMK